MFSSWQEEEDAAIVFALFFEFNSMGVMFRNLIISPFQSSNLIKPERRKSFSLRVRLHLSFVFCVLIKLAQFDTEARKWHCFRFKKRFKGSSVGFV